MRHAFWGPGARANQCVPKAVALWVEKTGATRLDEKQNDWDNDDRFKPSTLLN